MVSSRIVPLFFACLAILCSLLSYPSFAHAVAEAAVGAWIHHDLTVVLSPQEGRLDAQDTVRFPDGAPPEIEFVLHAGLNPVSRTPGVILKKGAKPFRQGYLESYRVRMPKGVNTIVLSYGGVIDHPLERVGKEQARGYSQTIGKISSEGVYLSGASHWYPVFERPLITFSLAVELPPGWEAVSQGERTFSQRGDARTFVRWTSPEPQEEIYLVAGMFHEYRRAFVRSAMNAFPGEGSVDADSLHAMVFLRSPDGELAERYLEATVRYIAQYEKLIGPYPYKKFALVENFWETGFGMPSFTLLGPKVIRLPFIVTTSYPHEILHTWWGNGVFPDYEEGNWSEGLTAYLSDHLDAEQRGEGKEYRLTTLQKYTDYVLGERDFPLTQFRARHSSPSEAIGYGKSLMFFHMLRRELGDIVFVDGLRHFYREHKFRHASFRDLRASFEYVSGKDLGSLFAQWITRSGAPEISVSDIRSQTSPSSFLFTAVVEQVQPGEAYRFDLPVAITLEGRAQAFQTSVRLEERRTEWKIELPGKPVRIDFDPEYDVFRRLHRNEIPPAITQVLGAEKLLIILPSQSQPELFEAYRSFAESLSNAGPERVTILLDRDAGTIPSEHAICILGRENMFGSEAFESFRRYGVTRDGGNVHILNDEVPYKERTIVLNGRNPYNPEMGLLFVTSDSPRALEVVARKLPHYHKYSYLAFLGDDASNVLKGRWPVTDSPMTVFLHGETGASGKHEMGRLRKRNPITAVLPSPSGERMMETIRFLSRDEMRGRAAGSREIDIAAEYIARQFETAGLIPAGDEGKGYVQAWEDADSLGQRRVLKNVVGMIPGKNPERAMERIVVGAHYDHLGTSVVDGGTEVVYRGADDNASGVAIVIELARLLGQTSAPDISIVFVAFDGEEIGRKGSRHFVHQQTAVTREKIIAMVNLDTVGRLRDNSLLVIGSSSAREWESIIREAAHQSGIRCDFVSEVLDSSDQVSFHEVGIPAVQLSTGPHPDYHKPSDALEKINVKGLERIAALARYVIERIVQSDESLTPTLESDHRVHTVSGVGQRRVSFGIIPDFTYGGDGSKVAGVIPNSPAARAGILAGDVITALAENEIRSLKDLSGVLKMLQPGDTVRVRILRDGEEMTVQTTVMESLSR